VARVRARSCWPSARTRPGFATPSKVRANVLLLPLSTSWLWSPGS
jgi:hypothetical protein